MSGVLGFWGFEDLAMLNSKLMKSHSQPLSKSLVKSKAACQGSISTMLWQTCLSRTTSQE